MSDPRTFVIVGAGQAARWLVLTLRDSGFGGRIVWFGDEPLKPYERPPLSKAALQGEAAGSAGLAPQALVPEAQWAALDVQWHGGVAVQAVNRADRTVTTAGGERVGYDRLFLATGGRARMLSGLAPSPRVLALRTWSDAQALKAALADARRVIVLGGGWIGLEVAASARQLGREVTVLEAAPRLCARTMPACVADHLLALHRAHGVQVYLGATVTAVNAGECGVDITLAGGECLHGELLVLGIGLVPNDNLAAEAGLDTGHGVHTDAHSRTSDPAIFAVGDVAHPLQADGVRRRIESWESAQRQAVAAAKAALGLAHDPAADGPPWFWSDQYGHNLQVLGLPKDDHHVIERHNAAQRKHLYLFCEGPRVRAVAAVNAGRELKIVRKWMREERYPELPALADASLDLNKLPLAAPE